MCGIAAWSGKDPKKFDLYKLGTLGIFNEKRGTHSCGLTVDFKIGVGVQEFKVFKDFMTTDQFKAPRKYPFAIAHTRKATGGAHNHYNAHPFGFGNDNGRHKFVGVHNGSLLNHKDLAESYEVDTDGLKDDGKTTRGKIDSEILLEIIYKTGNFKVLSEYNGAAALVFANIKEPNILYVFRGASKSKAYELEEERPLYYWRENKNSLYISSMKNSLEAIATSNSAKKNIHSFECNTIYKIKDGNINSAEKIKISRANAFKDYIPSYSKNSYGRNLPKNQSYYDQFCDEDSDYNPLLGACNNIEGVNLPALPQANKNQNKNKNCNLNPFHKHNIYNDRELVEKNSPIIQHYRTRYKRNGHNITGIYCWIPNYGFYPLHTDLERACDELYNLCGKEFNNHNFNQIRMNYKIANKGVIPFLADSIPNPEDYFFYFYDGIRLETKSDYIMIKENPYNKNFNTPQLSMAATHPIMDESVKKKQFMQQQVFYRGKLANGTFTYLGCNKIYTFENGNCKNIKPIAKYKMLSLNNDKTSAVKSSKEVFNKVNKDILDNELKNSNKVIDINKETEENQVKNIIFDNLFNTYNKLEECTQSLSVFSKNELAVKAVMAMDSFITDMEKIMEEDLQIELHGKK